MLMNDTVYLQTKVETNTMGSISIAWTEGTGICCDVQPLNKEKAFRDWGLTDANRYIDIFAPAGSAFSEGWQIKFDDIQYLVRVIENYGKIGLSNHMEIIASEVIG